MDREREAASADGPMIRDNKTGPAPSATRPKNHALIRTGTDFAAGTWLSSA